MKRKLIIGLILLVSSGYVLDLTFRGMNSPSDLYYIGGIFGSIVWFMLVVPAIWTLTTKERKHEAPNDIDNGSVIGE